MATFWTIGHSTRTLEAFLDLLKREGIEGIADVRHYPGSRRYPHFQRDALKDSLADAGLAYRHIVKLGGRRRPRPDSPNTAWRSEAFRGYADYMMTEEFAQGLVELFDFADDRRVAVMCAEAVWWRCHRGLIADRLKADGHEVLHILGPGKTEPHPFTSAATVVGGSLRYDGEGPS